MLRDGGIDFVGGSAHSVPFAFPNWKGGKLLGALAQNMYWFLVLRSNLKAKKGDINAIKGLNIGAAPLVDLGLKRMLVESGIDEERDKVKIVPGAPALSSARARPRILASALPRRCRRVQSMASGRTAWAPRSRCAAAPARS